MHSATHYDPPLVAIVTPVYNGAAFLAETMDAVQGQDYPNLIHIVQDNASTDATPEILARYKNARVLVDVVRSDTTVPIGRNWNATVRRVPAEAKYFRILCADDLIDPTFVTRMVGLAERHPSVVVVGCAIRHRNLSATDYKWDRDREVFAGREAQQRFFLGTGIIVPHQTLMRRDALDVRTPFFDEGLAACDTDIFLRLLREGDLGFVHEVLATTRDHPGTHSRSVINTLKMHQCEHLILLERHASFAFGPEEGRGWVNRYRRYYFRQLVKLGIRGPRSVFMKHVETLQRAEPRLLAFQLLDALIDWPLARLGARPIWSGYPFAD
jgi:glycosyltransferase involved in cell wall biosynthesis